MLDHKLSSDERPINPSCEFISTIVQNADSQTRWLKCADSPGILLPDNVAFPPLLFALVGY